MQKEIKQRANQLAAIMEERLKSELEYAETMLKENVMCLFDERKDNGGYPACAYADLLVTIMSLLINPKISSQLNTYDQENAGLMLKKVYDFFYSAHLQDVEQYSDYLRLSRYTFGLTDQDLNNLEEHYKLKQSA